MEANKAVPFLGPSVKLANELADLIQANKDPSLAPKIERCLEMVTKLDAYLHDTVSSPSTLSETILADSFSEPWEENKRNGLTPFVSPVGMISGPYAGQFLQIMAEITRAKKILEIGMFTGYSAVFFAQSPYCEEVVTLDVVPYLKDWVESRIAETPVKNKLRVMIGPAEDSLVTLNNEEKQFDLIFIDADKTEYIKYYKYIMDNNLLSKTGIFLCDNILCSTDPYMEMQTAKGKALKEFAQFVKDDERVTQVICPVRDGIMIITQKRQ